MTAGGAVFGAFQGFTAMSAVQVFSLAVAALLLAAGYLLMVLALRGADIAETAPFRFSVAVFAMVSGIAVFGEMPDRFSLAGIILIVAAGTYTIKREGRLAREADAGLNSQASPNV